MASLYSYSQSAFATAKRSSGGRSRHRLVEPVLSTPALLAATQLVGLAGAAAFTCLFAVFASASVTDPLTQLGVYGVLLAPLSVLFYFMREAVATLRSGRHERRRSAERTTSLVIDV